MKKKSLITLLIMTIITFLSMIIGLSLIGGKIKSHFYLNFIQPKTESKILWFEQNGFKWLSHLPGNPNIHKTIKSINEQKKDINTIIKNEQKKEVDINKKKEHEDNITNFKTELLQINKVLSGLVLAAIITPIFAGFSLISLGFYLYSRKRKA